VVLLIFFLILVVVVGGALHIPTGGNTTTTSVSSSSSQALYAHSIVGVGDSITEGFADPNNWPYHLKARLGGDWLVVNQGVGGDKTADMFARETYPFARKWEKLSAVLNLSSFEVRICRSEELGPFRD
jgi:hypothetical protein